MMNIIEKTYKWAKPLSKRSATDLLILHHAAATSCTAEDVHLWHVGNGWAGIGYHYLVRKDGTIYRGRPEDTVGAHAYGANSHSIGVCFEGNYEVEQTMPAAQLAAGQALVADIKRRWGITKVIGHKDVAGSTTDCPGKYFPFAEMISETETATSNTTTNNTTEEDIIMVATQMIGNGDRGNAVKSMQGALIAQGYPCGSYGADGICGAATVAAIKACQRANGLTADGICGPDTWGALLAK